MATKKPSLSSSETWKRRYGIGVKNQERMFRKFASWFDLMYAHINTSQYALWRSKVFIPIIPTKAWAMVQKLQALKPGFEVGLYGEALNDPDAGMKAQKAQWKLEHDWANPCFDEPMDDKLFSPLVDAVVTGTGIAKIPWTFTTKTRYEKYSDEQGKVDVTQDVKIDGDSGYNDLIPHDILATFIAPGAKNIYSASWVILEDWVTHDQLSDENEAVGFELNKNLDKVKDLKSETDRFATEKRSRRNLSDTDEDPLVSDSTITQFKRLECYEKSTMYRYVYAVGDNGDGEDQYIELYKGPLPYWHGKYPLVAFYTKKRPHNFWGQGVFEDTERMQSAFNDIFNHYMDNYNLSLDGMIMKQEDDEHTFIVQPGGEYLYKRDKPEQFKFPEPDSAMFTMVMDFIESQVEDATISRYATGTPNSSTDKTQGTASGIVKLTEMAGDKIGSMKQQFCNSLRQVGGQWLSNNQQFLDSDFTLMGEKDNHPEPVTITPKDMQGQMVLRINDASMEPMSKEEQLKQFEAYLASVMQMQQASMQQAQLTKWATPPLFLNFASLFQNLTMKFGQANFDKIILDADAIQKQMGANPSNAYLTPTQKISFDINELYGSEAGQLLQRDGITPDPARQQQVPQVQVDNATAQAAANQPPTEQGPDPIQTAKTMHDAKLAEEDQTFKHGLEVAKLNLTAQGQEHAQGIAEKQANKPQPAAAGGGK